MHSQRERKGACRPFWEDDGGFSTLGMVIALGLSLVLVFSGFRVYRVQTVSAGIQDVADAAALAAENQVSAYISVARICDAVVLSFSLAGIVTALIGVAALCIPPTAGYSEALLDAAKQIFSLRDRFAQHAAEGLELYQRCLPYLATVRAASVAQANSGSDGAAYVAIAVLAPFEGTSLEGFGEEDGQAQKAVQDAQDSAEEVRRHSEEAERLSKEADELKRKAWELDCGSADRCLRERAAHLAGLSGTANPQYSSPDTWSFNVPLVRCRAYYQKRLAAEDRVVPRNPEEAADSALRKRIYQYAVEEFAKAYARETEAGFDYFYPLLPRNMAELRQTPMYTEPIYPMAFQEDGSVMMHASSSCPGAAGCTAKGSIAYLDGCKRTMCPYCEFVPTSLANVCAATSVVNSGFEYYYRHIAELAGEYKVAQDKASESAAPAKRTVRSLLKSLGELLKQLGGKRIEIFPPGSYGAVSLVVDTSTIAVGGPFSNALLGQETQVGARVAVSAATLVEDRGEESQTVIRGLPALLGLTGVTGEAESGALGKVGGLVLSLWSGLIEAYNSGQDALERAAEKALGEFKWQSSSGLGTWAVRLIRGFLQDAGLQAAPVGYVKPVLVNTGLVAAADDSSWSEGFLAVKGAAGDVARAGEAVTALVGVLGSALSEDGPEEIPGEGIVITLTQQLFSGGSPLTIVFTLLSSDDAHGSGGRVWSWIIGGVLGIVGTMREIRDWR